MRRKDPLRNFRFRLEIDSIVQGFFSEVSIGDMAGEEPIDYRDGAERSRVRKLPGRTKYGNVSLKWGVTDSAELHEWHRAIAAGGIGEKRKTVTIVVLDETGADKASFLVSGAWPSKYDPSDLAGKGNEVFIELLELVNEGIDRIA
jgi:phage tail-like protein